MRVTISVGGIFHAFYLANELEKRGHLESIFTSFPRSHIDSYGVDRHRIRSFPLAGILKKACGLFPWQSIAETGERYAARLFDGRVERNLKPTDIFVGWSGVALKSLKKAKLLGAVTVLERGSTHIRFQRLILQEEFSRLGVRPRLPQPEMVERELEEYDVADYVCVPSSFAKETFIKEGMPERKIICINYGVDEQTFQPLSRRDDGFRVIFVGSLSVRKGVHYLLQAVAQFHLRDLEVCLVGPLSAEMKPYLRKHRTSFTYIGCVAQEKLPSYYARSSVLVLPSVEEGFGLVILQAMACGLPVICTEQCGGAEIIQDGRDGFVVGPRDAEALREKIEYLYQNRDLCRAMGESARQKVCSGYRWQDYGENVVAAYRKILNSS